MPGSALPGSTAAAAFARRALDFLYPPACVACGAATGATGGLCAACFREAPFIAGAVCDRCGAPLAGPPGPGLACGDCAAEPPPWDRGRAAALYAGPVRRAILALKRRDRLDVAPVAAIWLARVGAPLIAEAALVAPAPLHWRRLARRRFNQSAEIARALCRRLDRRDAFAPDLLARVKPTDSQEGKGRAARRANLAGAIAARSGRERRIEGATVVVVDDVMTTGATLAACAEALKAAGAARVHALCVARVPPPGRGRPPTQS